MARVAKCRRVCAEPPSRLFKSEGNDDERVVLCVEELESIRLTDFEDLDQAEAAQRMGVSRGTFQRILYEARHKVAEALVRGANIAIEGGNYSVSSKACGMQKRCKRCHFLKDAHEMGD